MVWRDPAQTDIIYRVERGSTPGHPCLHITVVQGPAQETFANATGQGAAPDQGTDHQHTESQCDTHTSFFGLGGLEF